MARNTQSKAEEAAQKQASLQQGVAEFADRVAGGVTTPVVADGDHLEQHEEARRRASEEAVRLAQEQAETDERRRREFLAAAKQGRRLQPIRATPVAVLDDPTLPLDKDGGLAGTPGYVKKWVRTIDGAENLSFAHAGNYAKHGYQPVRSRVDNEPLTQFSHVLMEAPPEADARRRATAMQGRIAAGKAAEEAYLDSVEATNRAAGYEMVQPFVGDGHGERRRFGGLVPEE